MAPNTSTKHAHTTNPRMGLLKWANAQYPRPTPLVVALVPTPPCQHAQANPKTTCRHHHPCSTIKPRIWPPKSSMPSPCQHHASSMPMPTCATKCTPKGPRIGHFLPSPHPQDQDGILQALVLLYMGATCGHLLVTGPRALFARSFLQSASKLAKSRAGHGTGWPGFRGT